MPAKEVHEPPQTRNGRLGTLVEEPKPHPPAEVPKESASASTVGKTSQPCEATPANTPKPSNQTTRSAETAVKPEAQADPKLMEKKAASPDQPKNPKAEAKSEKGVKVASDQAKERKAAKPTPETAAVSLPETNQFLQALTKQLRGQQRLNSNPAQLEIKVGREIAYRGTEGHTPEVNKISPQTLAYLKAAIKLPQADPKQKQPEKSLDRAITIKVNNEVVFKLSKGVVETNKLDSALTQQIGQAATPKSKETPEVAIPPSAVSPQPQMAQTTAEPTRTQSQPEEAPSRSTPATKTVPALEVVEQQIQKQPEGSVRQYLGQAVQALKAASQLAGAKAQKQIKDLPQQAQVVGTKVQQQIKDLPQQAVRLPQTIRDRQIAETALKLLDHYGTSDDKGKSYQAANYTIRTEGKDNYSISDSRGKELMKFKQNFLGPQVVSSQMSNRHQRDFAHARSQIQLKGGVPLLAGDAATRIRQLGSLTPAEDIAQAQEGKNIAAASIARNVLQALGSNRYENDQYRFQRQGDDLRISAKDGRGEILSLKEGQFTGNLKPLDVSNLKQLDRQLGRELDNHGHINEPSKDKQVAIGE